jgi:magnesium transporter
MVLGAVVLGLLWIRGRLGLELPQDVIAKGVWGAVAVLTVMAFWSVGSSIARGVAWPALAAGWATPWTWRLEEVAERAWLALVMLALALPAVGGGDVVARAAHEFPPPRIPALNRTTRIVVLFSLVVTSVLTFAFAALLSAGEARLWGDAPLTGLSQLLVGPGVLIDVMSAAVVLAAVLMIAPAAQAALADAEQTLRRLAREQALPERLALPHPRFGTLSRAIDVTAGATVLIMLVGAGRVSWLAHAYGFAIAVTTIVKAASLLRLRSAHAAPAHVTPLNVRIGGRDVPAGLMLTMVAPGLLAGAMLIGRDPSSIAAAGLLAGLTFLLTSRTNGAVARGVAEPLDTVELLPSTDVSLGHADVRSGNVLVTVRHEHSLGHVASALQSSRDRDVVVMTARLLGVDVDEDASDSGVTPAERRLFSQVVAVAERHNSPVRLLVVPAHNVFDAVVATVLQMRSAEVHVGESATLSADDQARLLGDAWERASKPETFDVRLLIHHHSGRTDAYHIGAHPPSLTPGDLDLIHRVWLDAVKTIGPHVHHHDVVRAALTQMEQQLNGPQRDEVLAVIRQAARPADELSSVVRAREFSRLRDMVRNRHASDLAALLTELSLEDQVVVFRVLPRKDAAAVFEYLSLEAQEALLKAMAQEDVATLLNNMAPDDRTMFLEELPATVTRQLLTLLTPAERSVAQTLLGYPEGSIGRLMTPQYVAVHEQWTVREVLDYIRTHGHDSETLNVIYVLDEAGALVDDIRIREFLLTSLDNRVAELMDRRFVSLKATDDQETAVAAFRRYDRTALPVTDSAGMLIGIVTIDDVLDVAEATATAEIQRIGGSEAFDEPYMRIAFGRMIQKRAGWLTALFLGEMLTATAMGVFEQGISRAVVLALFVPLIISSGGNSGSQASTLVIRALALGEVGLSDWWRVMRREILAGLALGAILGTIGFLRITIWSAFSDMYTEHWLLVAFTVGTALVGIVLWGTLIGSLLPFLLRRLGFDPATSSAPFVATLVDVTGLVIYFTVAMVILRGTLL